jgi:hypothetical protein
MIRLATKEDLTGMCAIGVSYHAAAELIARTGVEIDVASGANMILMHITNEKYIAVVEEDNAGLHGMCIGVVSSYPINSSVKIAQETICYGKSEDALRAAFDAEAIKKGATVAMISCFTRSENDRFRKLTV